MAEQIDSMEWGSSAPLAERPRRLYEQIAAQIEEMIEERGLNPGDRLPNERELAKLVGASRPTVREAIIALETSKIVNVRTGDGTYVVSRAHTPERKLPEFGPGVGPYEQFQARQVIEPATAAMAALTANDAEIDHLDQLIDKMVEVYPNLDFAPDPLGHEFHTSLAASARNTVLAAVVRQMWDLMKSRTWQHLREKRVTPTDRRNVIAARRRVVAALRARNSDQARVAMSDLLELARRRYFGGDL